MRWSKLLTAFALGAFAVILTGSGCGVESGGEIKTDAGPQDDGQSGTDGSGGDNLACQDDCPAGQQFCDGTGYRVCGNYDSDSCTEWSPRTECPSGSCADGQCTGGCNDQCAAFSRRCAGLGAYETCADHNQDSCLGWGGQTACDTGLICDEGYCVASCSNECTAGARQCAATANGIETCGNHDGDDCDEWGAFTECSAGEVCENGNCLPACTDECDQGDLRCVAGTQAFESCSDHDFNGCTDWGGLTQCPADQYCEVDTGLCVLGQQYPAGPYGKQIGDTMANECVERCLCNGSNSTGGEDVCMEAFLGSKAILVSVHAGW